MVQENEYSRKGVSADCNEKAYPHVNKLRGFARTWPELLSCKIANPITTGFVLLFLGYKIAC
jgi:hypothetical protein